MINKKLDREARNESSTIDSGRRTSTRLVLVDDNPSISAKNKTKSSSTCC